jgi:hypothetical protein
MGQRLVSGLVRRRRPAAGQHPARQMRNGTGDSDRKRCISGPCTTTSRPQRQNGREGEPQHSTPRHIAHRRHPTRWSGTRQQTFDQRTLLAVEFVEQRDTVSYYVLLRRRRSHPRRRREAVRRGQTGGCGSPLPPRRSPRRKWAAIKGPPSRPIVKADCQGRLSRPIVKADCQGRLSRPIVKADCGRLRSRRVRSALYGPRR